ncbi:hypothetical protein AGDE_14322 [Angomonas deanei]|uniref:Leucine Rich repeat n=1 Tax=Angomonas deanei TaxID=59799 RepID=A0A7G2CDZ5_9TRYP|nr:hypothetical protein AGDE_14322 [Angomonas deanei]CAD2218078.1 hypothetical protein, conserved [Angomonas deanei]|eukprot:EPY21042.1 hypothetical protein AGDE_14322 [Angomonas deanei]
MSIFAGLSLKEIYVKRCKEVGCKPNSSLRNALSDKPDDFDSLSFIDVSKNFLGPKGILPLIDVVRCAQKIHTLDFREQQLTNEVVKKLCHALVRHQGITRINMSNNPITIAAGTYILELVIQNSNIEYIGLDNTVVRQAVLEKVNTMTAKNSEKKLRRKTLLSDTFDKSLSAKVEKPQKRVSLLDLKNTLSTFLHDKHEFLFQDNPLDALSQLCMSQSAWFFDVQFPADDSALHMEITKRYNVSRWKRLNEIYPK